MAHSLTIIVPAFNEEDGLRPTVEQASRVASAQGLPHEIIIVDDASRDATPAIADRLAEAIPGVRVIHHDRNLGLGAAYKTGIAAMRHDFVMLLPGDNAVPEEAVATLLKHIGDADIVIPYHTVAGDKNLPRRILSSGFTGLVNTLFGLEVPYYNGYVIHRRQLIRSTTIKTDGFAYQAEALVQLLKRGHSYICAGVTSAPRAGGKTKAFRILNVIGIACALLHLRWRMGLAPSFLRQAAAGIRLRLGLILLHLKWRWQDMDGHSHLLRRINAKQLQQIRWPPPAIMAFHAVLIGGCGLLALCLYAWPPGCSDIPPSPQHLHPISLFCGDVK